MATLYSLTYLSISLTFFGFLLLTCSAASIASDQLKFWSQNVHNRMPSCITKKLTTLTKKDAELFSNMISNNNEFTADAKFCKLAHLACSSVFETSKAVSKEYSQKTYAINSAVLSSDKTKDDPFSFFRLSILKKGNDVHLPDLEESMPDRAFLPSTVASKVSLTSANKLSKIFHTLSSKTMKENIDTAVRYCNANAIQGEVKSCAKSLEEMILFSKSALGGKKLVSLTSQNMRGSNSVTKVSNIKKIGADKIVACHEVFLPFATYFCHSLSSTNLYVVDLVDVKSGSPVNTMLAICHMDTSPWPANHVAFRILKFPPGHGEACHWFTQLDLAWVAKEDKT